MHCRLRSGRTARACSARLITTDRWFERHSGRGKRQDSQAATALPFPLIFRLMKRLHHASSFSPSFYERLPSKDCRTRLYNRDATELFIDGDRADKRYRPISLFVDATTRRLGGHTTVVQRRLFSLRLLFYGFQAKPRDEKAAL